MEALERVRRVEPGAVLDREVPVGEDVLGRLLEQRCGLRKAGPQPIGDFLELGERSAVIGLRKDRPEEGGFEEGFRSFCFPP